MKLKTLVLAFVLVVWCSAPSRAAEHYRFRVAEGTQALPAEELLPNMKQLAGKPLMVLIGIEGTRWRWMLNGCPPVKPCEWRIDHTGGRGGAPDEDPAVLAPPSDVGLQRISATRFRVRCLRASCVVQHGPVDGKRMRTATLRQGKSIKLRTGRVIDVQLADKKK